MDLQPGMVIGGYARLLRLLGQGGMGSVWLAEHLRLETEVAIKMLVSPEYRKVPQLVERFQREAKAAAQITDPHIVQILDHGLMDDGSPFIVMERLHGESLRERLIRTGVVDLNVAAQILEQAATALGAAHRKEIIHRDIKPDNIFLCGDHNKPFVKVLDFGIAIKTGFDAEQKRLTTTAQMVGTPAYMSPEQILSPKRPGPSVDIWALAVTAYEMVTGDIPFDGPTIGAMMMTISNGRYLPPSQKRPSVGSHFDNWCARAFSLQQEQRYRSAAELAKAFATCCEQAGQQASLPSAMQRPSQPVQDSGPRLASEVSTAVPDAADPTQLPATQVMRPQDEAEAPTPKLAQAHSMPTTPIRGKELATFDGASTPVRKRHANRSRWLIAGAAGLVLLLTALGVSLQLSDSPAPAALSAAPISTAAAVISSAAALTSNAASEAVPEGMLAVRAGRYSVGCSGGRTDGCFTDEGPVHQVSLQAFGLMQREVSTSEYERCVKDGKCAAAGKHAPAGERTKCRSRAEQPVRCVRWKDADRYCRYRGWRLPTEQEWEAAARGDKASRYSWGQEQPSCARTVMRGSDGLGCGSGGPKKVSSDTDRSWMGALNMMGNVREWTASSYRAYPGGRTVRRVNRRINRGGSYEMRASEMASAWTRHRDKPSAARPDLGFRCAADIPK